MWCKFGHATLEILTNETLKLRGVHPWAISFVAKNGSPAKMGGAPGAWVLGVLYMRVATRSPSRSRGQILFLRGSRPLKIPNWSNQGGRELFRGEEWVPLEEGRRGVARWGLGLWEFQAGCADNGDWYRGTSLILKYPPPRILLLA